jgi:hypothetical protein
MDPNIWRHLPTDIVRKIIRLLGIDVRLAFKVPPRKLVLDKNLKFKNEIVYDMINHTLRQVEVDPELETVLTIWRRGIKLSAVRPGPLYIFNMEWEPYELTMSTEDFILGPAECQNHIVVNKSIKFI